MRVLIRHIALFVVYCKWVITNAKETNNFFQFFVSFFQQTHSSKMYYGMAISVCKFMCVSAFLYSILSIRVSVKLRLQNFVYLMRTIGWLPILSCKDTYHLWKKDYRHSNMAKSSHDGWFFISRRIIWKGSNQFRRPARVVVFRCETFNVQLKYVIVSFTFYYLLSVHANGWFGKSFSKRIFRDESSEIFVHFFLFCSSCHTDRCTYILFACIFAECIGIILRVSSKF